MSDRDKNDREKNERVIHTRVPERLEAELKGRAEALGVSVSNLVRNVLNNTFGLVEEIVADSARLAETARSTFRAPAAPPPAAWPDIAHGGRAPSRAAATDVIGWQELILGKNAVCDRCNTILPRGQDAAIAIVDGPGPRPILCLACLEELRHGTDRRNVRNPDGSDHT